MRFHDSFSEIAWVIEAVPFLISFIYSMNIGCARQSSSLLGFALACKTFNFFEYLAALGKVQASLALHSLARKFKFFECLAALGRVQASLALHSLARKFKFFEYLAALGKVQASLALHSLARKFKFFECLAALGKVQASLALHSLARHFREKGRLITWVNSVRKKHIKNNNEIKRNCFTHKVS